MAERSKAAGRDVALLYGPTEDGKGARVVRAREGSLETGEVRPARDGQPLNHGELVRLSPRADAPCICDVEVLHAQPSEQRPSEEATGSTSAPQAAAPVPTRGRPPQVASDDYRMNWDRIFGSPARRAKRDRSLN
jgi:hypothetical protein